MVNTYVPDPCEAGSPQELAVTIVHQRRIRGDPNWQPDEDLPASMPGWTTVPGGTLDQSYSWVGVNAAGEMVGLLLQLCPNGYRLEFIPLDKTEVLH